MQRNKGNASSVCKTIGPYQVRFEDLQSLEGTNWITDQVNYNFFWKELSFLLNRTDDLPLPKCIWFKKNTYYFIEGCKFLLISSPVVCQ